MGRAAWARISGQSGDLGVSGRCQPRGDASRSRRLRRVNDRQVPGLPVSKLTRRRRRRRDSSLSPSIDHLKTACYHRPLAPEIARLALEGQRREQTLMIFPPLAGKRRDRAAGQLRRQTLPPEVWVRQIQCDPPRRLIPTRRPDPPSPWSLRRSGADIVVDAAGAERWHRSGRAVRYWSSRGARLGRGSQALSSRYSQSVEIISPTDRVRRSLRRAHLHLCRLHRVDSRRRYRQATMRSSRSASSAAGSPWLMRRRSRSRLVGI